MKLFLLLVAIYSLIFYQSYKIEKHRDSSWNIKENLQTEKNFKAVDAGKEYQNAILLFRNDNINYTSLDKKQPLLRRLAFY